MTPDPEAYTLISATVPAVGVHPLIVPASVEKMNRADTFEGPTGKPEPPLKTSPVGPPVTVTSSPNLAPAALYKVDRSAWLSATHHGVAGPASSPQAFRRFGSTTVFGTPLLETSGVTSYALSSEFLCAAATWGASKQAMDTNSLTKTRCLPTRNDAEAHATVRPPLHRSTSPLRTPHDTRI